MQQADLKLRSNSLISIVRVDGSRISGRLASIDFDQELLTMHPLDRAGRAPTTLQIAKIAKIQYRRAGKPKPAWMVLGLIGGAFFGAVIGNAIDPPESIGFGPDFGGGPIGLVIGASGGLLIGSFVPMAFPSTHTIKCK